MDIIIKGEQGSGKSAASRALIELFMGEDIHKMKIVPVLLDVAGKPFEYISFLYFVKGSNKHVIEIDDIQGGDVRDLQRAVNKYRRSNPGKYVRAIYIKQVAYGGLNFK